MHSTGTKRKWRSATRTHRPAHRNSPVFRDRLTMTTRLFDLDGVVQFIVHQDPSAVLANDDLFALTDFALALGRDGIATAAARITEYRHHRQTVPVIAADTIIRMQ